MELSCTPSVAGLGLALALLLASAAGHAAPPQGTDPPKVPVQALKKCTLLHPGECAALDDLLRKGAAGQQTALAMLDSDDPWVRRAGARVLLQLPLKEAAPKLARLVDDPDAAVRADALDALGMTGDAAQGPVVVALLGHEKDPAARVAALRALGRLRAEVGLPVLLAALEDPDRHAALAAVDALGAIGAADAVVPVSTLLADPRVPADVQAAAARALARLGDARSIPNLMLATGNADVEVRRQAIVALGILRAKQAIDLLIERLSDDTVLREAVVALGNIDDPRTLDPLLTVLRVEDVPVDVRRAILEALGRRKVTDAVPELMAMLREGAGPLAVDAIRALGAIGDERAIARLIELLRSPDPEVVGAANSALHVITGKTFDPNPDYWNQWLTERGTAPGEGEDEP